ncbi:fungal-specific transcription factor domain-containing protein [Triangularia setosa]|uniref:Fungal-specific transcription factor domain-containing protein n=1 Tax=Triangularia setosa TaxID=2587417 RepID=A0AAN6W7I0_9PEZI|nr:fungal-specific transcription factor domain-containing protein [Podospora setosa]
MDPEHRNERQKRRKISLACEPCRERKSRCDGAKPICSTCQRRSLPLHQCIYTVDNARTASNEAYIRVLHERIQRLERACSENGIPTPPLDPGESSDPTPGPSISRRSVSAQPPPLLPQGPAARPNGLLTPAAIKDHVQCTTTTATTPAPVVPHHRHHHLTAALSPRSPDCEGLDATENATKITAMGTVSAEHDVNQAFEETQDEFYGSSSAASFMKEAYGSVKPHHHYPTSTRATAAPPVGLSSSAMSSLPGSGSVVTTAARRPAPKADFGPLNFLQPDRFALPPRNVADYLVGRFFERVYWLYPFFHKPTFMYAYRQLWQSSSEAVAKDSEAAPAPGLGLGSSPGADAGSIVFHSALNTIFAIGCQFSDLSAKDRVSAIETFLERAKKFVGLDLIDMHNVGVVQSLLLMTLLLQSTPFPSRCWNSLGVAGRVAQGLGLHTEAGRRGRSELEREVRRRTWHGCVILDIIVSMTFGRPTMTDVNDLSLPSRLELEDNEWAMLSASEGNGEVAETSRMNFFVEYIRQCHILGEILSSIYLSPKGRGGPSSSSGATGDESPLYGLDAILELDAKLSKYEVGVVPIMSWTGPSNIGGMPEYKRKIIVTQRNVLHASFLYVRLMLHRPILTQLCSNSDSGSAEPTSPVKRGNRMLYASFAAECAKICLGAAMDLIELVYSTYQTDTTGGWWWDGLYAFTGGLAVIVAYLCPSLLDSMDQRRLERSWVLCQEILAHFASFSISAHRSLKLLQKVHGDVMARVAEQAGDTTRPVLPTPIATAATPAGQGIMMLGDDDSNAAQTHHTPLDFGNGLQWQVPSAGDLSMLSVTSLFNWDQPLDFFTGGLGTDSFQ